MPPVSVVKVCSDDVDGGHTCLIEVKVIINDGALRHAIVLLIAFCLRGIEQALIELAVCV